MVTGPESRPGGPRTGENAPFGTPAAPAPGSVVVLGGAGYVGRHVCAAFAALGHEVVRVGRRPPERPMPYRQLTLDLAGTDPEALAEALDAERPDTVVNCVGSIWGRTDDQMWSATAVPTLRLLDALARLATRPRLVHLGSVLEYGPVPPGTSVGADTTPRPDTAYGRSKLAASDAVLRATADGRVDGVVLRVSNVSGPGTPRISLLGQVAERLLAADGTGTEAVVELSRLSAHRDYVDVRDVADAVIAAAHAPAVPVPVAIGRGEAVSVRALVDLFIEVSGVPARVVERPAPDPGPAQPPPSGQSSPSPSGRREDRLRVDTGPARALLGWEPRRSLRESVLDCWLDLARAHRSPTTPSQPSGG
ncbi:NAD-dependent epimerase/dehydratase family protein [Streptomyces sp. NPDC000594]|uniref:NAD-dependent epimerase/dehydratase family protein n=1 Tax=Streptomyces sp. NPDC000594 TaxID=3154261 RepID=UPI00332C309B